MTAWPGQLLGGVGLLTVAVALALHRRFWAAAAAWGWLLAVVALTASTLHRGPGPQAPGALRLLGELTSMAGAAACAGVLGGGWARRPGRLPVAAAAVLLAAIVFVPAVRVASNPSASVAPGHADADSNPASANALPWVSRIRGQLHEAAAGRADQALAAVRLAAEHGADVATLRALCPDRLGSHGAAAAAGTALCLAVCAPLPEVGAQQLACASSDEVAELGQHRCRISAELLAAAGDLTGAERAARAAGPLGALTLQALWRARHLPLPDGLAQAPGPAHDPLQLWPDARSISPQALGFTTEQVPGSLTWHPGPPDAPAVAGVVSARSPYRGALTTAVPVPVPQPHSVRLTIWGQPGLAITFAGAAGVAIYRCAEAQGAGSAPNALPKAACQERWVQLLLTPQVGAAGIASAHISGEFMLASWQWRRAEEAL